MVEGERGRVRDQLGSQGFQETGEKGFVPLHPNRPKSKHAYFLY